MEKGRDHHLVSMRNGLHMTSHLEGTQSSICMKCHVVSIVAEPHFVRLVGLRVPLLFEQIIALCAVPLTQLALLHHPGHSTEILEDPRRESL